MAFAGPDDWMQIYNLLCSFQQAFDDRDWSRMRDCLAEQICTDYSSFRKTSAETLAAEEYISQRQSALAGLLTQHNFSNLQVELDGAHARGHCNYVIHRFHPDFRNEPDKFFHSCGRYLFEFERSRAGWKITAITQKLLKNHGNPALHGATR
jgi:3-phenylpropionate/cinnamic acid dioxygenase small subunit